MGYRSHNISLLAMSDNLTILHNPRCSKSRQTLQLIEEQGEEAHVLKYLETSPTADELRSILKKLGMPAQQIIRKGETIYKQEYKGKDLTEEEWIQAMVTHPILIERPIVVKGDKAVLGRPPENVKLLFS